MARKKQQEENDKQREEIASAGQVSVKLPDTATLKLAHGVTMGVAIFAFIYEGLAYNVIFLGRILPAAGQLALAVPFAVLFNGAWVLALWSYFKAHLSDPGRIPEQWHDFVRTTGEALPVAAAKAEWQPAQATFCKKCLMPRPERAHHCLVCGVCVLRMDHHCPWINNCVGFGNHKVFILLGIYATAACAIGLASALPQLVHCLRELADKENGCLCHPHVLQPSEVVAFLVFGALASTVGAMLVHMLSVHLPLLCRNSTSIEDCYENMHNPFDQGRILANIAQVFGAYGADWFVPVRPVRPLGDGVAFTCGDEERLSLTAGDHEGLDRFLMTEETGTDLLWRARYQVRPPPKVEPAGDPPFLSLKDFFGCSGKKRSPFEVCNHP